MRGSGSIATPSADAHDVAPPRSSAIDAEPGAARSRVYGRNRATANAAATSKSSVVPAATIFPSGCIARHREDLREPGKLA
jgi:hypothetical protein